MPVDALYLKIYVFSVNRLPNFLSFQFLFRLFLNWFTDSTRITSEGSPFHSETDLIEKLILWPFYFFSVLNTCTRVLKLLNEKILSKQMFTFLVMIL